jgi:ribosomal-protein-alanine N-acetyltransferase
LWNYKSKALVFDVAIVRRSMMSISIFHGLQGEKIYFKALSIDDVEAIHSYASDPNVKKFIGWPLMKTLEDTRKHIEGMIQKEEAGTHQFVSIVLKENNEVIGTAIVFNFDKEANNAEIGYVLHADHWGKGYGTEVVALVSDYVFKTLKLHRLHARVVHVNTGSARILEKNGFDLEGRLREHHFIDGKYYDCLIYGKL